MNKQQNAIQLTNISKKYEIHHEKPTLVEKFIKGKNEIFWALRNINLTIKKGERVGIIGSNGSGKTTLLKAIAGITTPTTGTITTIGKVVSLIDLEAGFHPDLTGYQNIFLNGMLLGIPYKTIESKLQSIITFADIKQFIDAPLFTYSYGMTLRLGFAIAIHANFDILLLDENLSAGDKSFRKKAQTKINEIYKQAKTIITVTHNLDTIAQTCTRVIRLEKGSIIRDGKLEVLSQYDPSWKRTVL